MNIFTRTEVYDGKIEMENGEMEKMQGSWNYQRIAGPSTRICVQGKGIYP